MAQYASGSFLIYDTIKDTVVVVSLVGIFLFLILLGILATSATFGAC